MIKEYNFNVNSKSDIIMDIGSVVLIFSLGFMVFISYGGLFIDYSAPLFMFSGLLVFVIYYTIKWFVVLKKRRIKKIIVDMQTFDITLTTLSGIYVSANLKDVKYTRNMKEGISDIKIKGKKYPGVYNLDGCEELSALLFSYCKKTI